MGTHSSWKSGATDAVRCSGCTLGEICVAAGSDQATLIKLDELLEVDATIESGVDVFRRGDPFTGLVAVRSGCFKSYILDRDGNEQVQGFHFPGELIGLDAVQSGDYRNNVQSLGRSALCRLDYNQLLRLSACSAGLQSQLFRLFSSRLAAEQWRSLDFSAEERLAAFLLDISERLERRSLPSQDFELVMPRSDIANYLALATETVSRVFSKMRKARLIDVTRRNVRLADMAGLRAIAEPVFEAR